VCSNKYKYYKRGSIHIRAVNIYRDGDQYGPYYQAVRSCREQGKVTQEVIHFGEHTTIESALQYWPQEIEELKRIDRPNQADKLQGKLYRLHELSRKEYG
jgi:hypothetical protein